MLTIEGTAPLKAAADAFIKKVAAHDATVNAIVSAQDIRLLVLVVAEGGDQETTVKWAAPNTRITITMPIGADPSGLHSGLLHELILHAAPAARKHVAARAQNAVPDYPDSDDDERIEAEEAAEHTNENLWLTAIRIAVQMGDAELRDRVVISAATYSRNVAHRLVAVLQQQGGITEGDAKSLNHVIDADDTDDGSSGDEANT